MKKKGFNIVFLLLLIKFNLNSTEELLDLTCQDSTHCKQYELDGIAVSCEDGLCHCWKSNNHNNNNNNNNNNNDKAQLQKDISKGQKTECRPKDHIKSNIIGGSCPCTIRFAECDEEQHVCYCARDFVASLDRRRCLKESVPLGDACETDKQCALADVYAVCDPTKLICQCGPGFVQYNATCFSTVGDDSLECPKATQCDVYGTGAFCSNTHNKCLCLKDYISVAEKLNCIPVSDFKEPCSEATQCVRKLGLGGTCYAGHCNCDAATHFVQPRQLPNGTEWTTCEPKVVLGNYCRTQNDCYQHHLSRSSQSMQCSYAECNCRIGFNNAIEKNSCTPDNFSPLQSAVTRLDYFKWFVFALVNLNILLWIPF